VSSPFRPGPSWLLALACFAVHMAALQALFNSAVPLTGQLLLSALLGLHGVAQVRRALRVGDNALSTMHVDETGILLEFNNKRRIPVYAVGIYCTTAIQVIRFRRQGTDSGSVFCLSVLPDTTDADTRRQLRAWLLTAPLRQVASQAAVQD
jgi:hypothetical protein